MISLNSDRTHMLVNTSLQERGIYFIIFGIVVNYVFVIANVLISTIKSTKQFLNKKSSPRNKNDLTIEKRRLIYYTDKKPSAKHNPEIRRKVRAMSWLSFNRLRFKRSRVRGTTQNLQKPARY